MSRKGVRSYFAKSASDVNRVRVKIALLLAGTGLLVAIPVFAHSFAAEYDRNNPIKFNRQGYKG